MDVRYHISPSFTSKYYKFLVLLFSNGQVFISTILKSTGSIIHFFSSAEFKSLYLTGYFNIPPIEV